MKRFVAYPLLVFLAALIFYGGAGVNFISYCCGDCEDEGIEVLVEDMCCDIHEHAHDSLPPHPSNLVHTHGCGIERVNFDWNSVHMPTFILQPLVCDLFFSRISDISLVSSFEENKYLPSAATGPPIKCPRTYLSFLTTLLI